MITTAQPDIQREPYGPDKEQVFHLWRARDRDVVPALVHFNGADPDVIPPDLVVACRDAGVAVVSVGFRPFDRGFPLPQQDAVRAVQHIRHHAARLGVDPRRLAVGGTSAGSGIAMYCAYHADFADPSSDDPVARESSRVQCVTVSDAQSSYDPRDRARWFGDRFRWKKGTPDWAMLDQRINSIPGVLGHGIFIGLASKIIVGEGTSARVID
jgi:hypothetical protein